MCVYIVCGILELLLRTFTKEGEPGYVGVSVTFAEPPCFCLTTGFLLFSQLTHVQINMKPSVNMYIMLANTVIHVIT